MRETFTSSSFVVLLGLPVPSITNGIETVGSASSRSPVVKVSGIRTDPGLTAIVESLNMTLLLFSNWIGFGVGFFLSTAICCVFVVLTPLATLLKGLTVSVENVLGFLVAGVIFLEKNVLICSDSVSELTTSLMTSGSLFWEGGLFSMSLSGDWGPRVLLGLPEGRGGFLNAVNCWLTRSVFTPPCGCGTTVVVGLGFSDGAEPRVLGIGCD